MRPSIAFVAIAPAPITSAAASPAGAVARRFYSAEELAQVPQIAIDGALGVASPLRHADIEPGDTVLDLGCGGGLDVLLAAQKVGPTGKAIGIDMTPEMIALARKNAALRVKRPMAIWLVRQPIRSMPKFTSLPKMPWPRYSASVPMSARSMPPPLLDGNARRYLKVPVAYCE